MLIIVKSSRDRAVRMQKDLINKVLNTNNGDRKQEGFKDFQAVSKEAGLYDLKNPKKHLQLKVVDKKIVERSENNGV